MAPTHFLLHFLFIFSIFHVSFATSRLTELVQVPDAVLKYHNGPLLTGNISVNLIWYGNFKPTQKSIISDFITALTATSPPQPSVSTWWKTIAKYNTTINKPLSVSIQLGKQISDPTYSLGKSLTDNDLAKLSSKHASANAVNIILTANDVFVTEFCNSRCGTHSIGLPNSKNTHGNGNKFQLPYIWVGNPETQCPGQCAWPFHQFAKFYGPQGAPLVAPNNDVGLDGIVISLASLLAGTVTNPFGNGYYQGDASMPLEASTACKGVYGTGAYPGYPGHLLVDPTTGASYNAYGTNGRKYLVPAILDPSTSTCLTLV